MSRIECLFANVAQADKTIVALESRVKPVREKAGYLEKQRSSNDLVFYEIKA